jgi:hypothetical protein
MSHANGSFPRYRVETLEVSVPLPAKPEANVRKVQIEEPKTAAKSAA